MSWKWVSRRTESEFLDELKLSLSGRAESESLRTSRKEISLATFKEEVKIEPLDELKVSLCRRVSLYELKVGLSRWAESGSL